MTERDKKDYNSDVLGLLKSDIEGLRVQISTENKNLKDDLKHDIDRLDDRLSANYSNVAELKSEISNIKGKLFWIIPVVTAIITTLLNQFLSKGL